MSELADEQCFFVFPVSRETSSSPAGLGFGLLGGVSEGTGACQRRRRRPRRVGISLGLSPFPKTELPVFLAPEL